MSAQTGSISAKPGERCLARSVAEALSENPGLEAVTIDRTRQTVSLATLGRADIPKLTERINFAFEEALDQQDESRCGLLAGDGDCKTCAHSSSDVRQGKVIVRHEENSTTISRVTCPTAPSFWRWRQFPLPKVVPREYEFPEDEHGINEWKGQLIAALLCGAFGLSAWLLRDYRFVSLVGFLLSYLAGSWFTAQEVWERLQKGALDVHFLMLAVAAGSAAIGAWGEGATLLFLFSFSGALEHFALGRTQREIRSLFRDAPKTGTVIDRQGREQEIEVNRLRAGMRLLVKPGAQFPVDAEVLKGNTASDESNLTGEAAPVEKGVGDKVLAGTINLWGAVEVMALRPAAESALQKIIHLIRHAQQQKAPVQQFTDKFSTYYTYFALGLSLVMFFVWWLVLGYPPFSAPREHDTAFYHTMTLLVVASPCALVLSIPSAVLAAIAWAARHGILFRGGAAVEKLAEINTVALDKTGTLTTGELEVEKIESFPPGREQEVARLAFSLERLSSHPLARAITRYGKQQGLQPFEATQFESITGHGLKARWNGGECYLGRRDWILERTGAAFPSNELARNIGISEVWVSAAGLLGRLTLRDDIRPQSRDTLAALKAEGLKTLVLTGDHRAAADHISKALPVDEVKAELRPEQKLEEIRALATQGGRVAMVGDGVNDAPSLAAAHIGVAMGARGSDAALEQADVVLMHDRLENFLAAFRLSQRARRIIRQNLVVSLGTVLVLVTCALLGKIPLTVGVVGHEGSTVIVVMNSLRLLFGRAPGKLL